MTTLSSLLKAPQAPFALEEVQARTAAASRALQLRDYPKFIRGLLDLLKYQDTSKGALQLLAAYYREVGEREAQRVVVSLMEDAPVVSFGDGFYPDEDGSGSRWMSRKGVFRVRNSSATPAGKLAFTLVSFPRFDDYRVPSFRCDLWYNDSAVGYCTFSAKKPVYQFRVALPENAEPVAVRLSCAASFRPCEDGKSADVRDLAIFLRDVAFLPQ